MEISTNKSRWSRRLFPTLVLALSALFLLTLPPVSTGATGLASGARQGLQTVTASAEASTDEDVPRWVDDVVIWKQMDTCATVKISPPTVSTPKDSSFSFDVAIEGAQNLGAFQFDLTYPTGLAGNDPAHPACATLGPFLGSTGRSVTGLTPQRRAGSLTYGAYSVGSSAGPTGNGVLATVHLKAKNTTGTGTLHLQIGGVQVWLALPHQVTLVIV